MKITNEHDISLPLAVWLLADDYDYVLDPKYISVTTLLRSTKQIILGARLPDSDRVADVSDFIARTFGHAVHDSMEKAWKGKYARAMKMLGYPEHVIDRIVINPTDEQLKANPNNIPIYIERRSKKDFNGWTIGGKFDKVMDGHLFDAKSTSVYSYLKGGKEDDYVLQGSLYRWLNQDIITEDQINVQFIFTDWQRSMIKSNPDYPKIKLKEVKYNLLSIQETEAFIRRKTDELARYWDKPQEDIPECTDKELWRAEPQYKYYSDPTKTDGKSTKNFTSLSEAKAFAAEKGKGVVITKLGEPKACEYCAAFPICQQKDKYFAE